MSDERYNRIEAALAAKLGRTPTAAEHMAEGARRNQWLAQHTAKSPAHEEPGIPLPPQQSDPDEDLPGGAESWSDGSPRDVFTDAVKFWNALPDEHKRGLYNVYVKGEQPENDKIQELHDHVANMPRDEQMMGRGYDPAAHIEALAADEFGAPEEASKGAMMIRDSKRLAPKY